MLMTAVHAEHKGHHDNCFIINAHIMAVKLTALNAFCNYKTAALSIVLVSEILMALSYASFIASSVACEKEIHSKILHQINTDGNVIGAT